MLWPSVPETALAACLGKTQVGSILSTCHDQSQMMSLFPYNPLGLGYPCFAGVRWLGPSSAELALCAWVKGGCAADVGITVRSPV